MIDLVNIERAKPENGSLAALSYDYRLHDAALSHSLDMATNYCFQHDSCDDTNWADRVRTYYPTGGIAENIAAGYSTPADVVVGWMNSPGHKANILNGTMQGIGVGYVYNSDAPWGSYWTQNFGTLTPLAAVPEPETYAMMLLGLGVLGWAGKRRKAA